jgi:hypothetical protein
VQEKQRSPKGAARSQIQHRSKAGVCRDYPMNAGGTAQGAVEGTARFEIQAPSDLGWCLYFESRRSLARRPLWAGVPPALIRRFQPEPFGSSDLRIFDAAVGACSSTVKNVAIVLSPLQ